MSVLPPSNEYAAPVQGSYKSQSHGSWNCNYDVIIVPRFRWHILFVPIAEQIVEILKELATTKECSVLNSRFDRDHVYLTLSIPPKLAVTSAIQSLKNGSSLRVHDQFAGMKQKALVQNSIWSRGYCVATDKIEQPQIAKFAAEQWAIDQYFDGPQVDHTWSDDAPESSLQ